MSNREKTAFAGAAILGITALLIRFFLMAPIAAAEAGRQVTYSEKAIVLMPTCLVMGLVALGSAALFPRWVEAQAATKHVRFQERSLRYKATLVGAVCVTLGAGLLLRAWFLERLTTLGYR